MTGLKGGLGGLDPRSPIFSGCGGSRLLFDCENLDFLAVHPDGLADPLSNQPMGKWGHIGESRAPGSCEYVSNT
jgi:hypothetical protein